MAYMRGQYYLWRGAGKGEGEDDLHLWVTDGWDGWDRSVWATAPGGGRRPGLEKASGVAIPLAVMDEYVVMRLVELIEAGQVAATIERAKRHGRHDFAAQSQALLEGLAVLKETSDD